MPSTCTVCGSCCFTAVNRPVQCLRLTKQIHHVSTFNYLWRLLASSDFGGTLSVGATCFEDGFCADEKMGDVWAFLCIWQLPRLPIEWLWSALAEQFLTLLAQMAQKPLPSFYRGTISETIGIFQPRRAFAGQRALTIKNLPMSGLRSWESVKDALLVLAPSKSGNTDQRRYP